MPMSSALIAELVSKIKDLREQRRRDIEGTYEKVTNAIELLKEIDVRNETGYTDLTNVLRDLNDAHTPLPYLYGVDISEQDYELLGRNIETLVSKHDIDNIALYRNRDNYLCIDINGINAVISESDPNTRTEFSVPLGKFNLKILTAYNFVNKDEYSLHYSNIRKIHAEPAGNNNPKRISGNNCYHPHIDYNGFLCRGSYGSSGDLREDIKSFNFYSIFFNIASLLNRYNANSLFYPGAYIYHWIGHKCSSCAGFAGEDSAVQCAKTYVYMHKECAIEIDGKYYRPSLVKKCNTCSKPSAYYTTIQQNGSSVVICDNCPIPE